MQGLLQTIEICQRFTLVAVAFEINIECIVPWNILAAAGLVRKKKAGMWSPLPSSIRGEWLAINDKKKNILASLCLASYLAANWLQKLKTKHCLFRRSYFCSCVCVCVCVFVCVRMVSQFDLFITKPNLFVRCQSLSHIPNTSLQCSNSHYGSWTWWRG